MKSTRHTKRGIQARRLDPELLEELKRPWGTIDTAINRFEQVVDPTLIDCYIYELKAAQLRYQFLLRSIKEQETNYSLNWIYTHSACCRGRTSMAHNNKTWYEKAVFLSHVPSGYDRRAETEY